MCSFICVMFVSVFMNQFEIAGYVLSGKIYIWIDLMCIFNNFVNLTSIFKIQSKFETDNGHNWKKIGWILIYTRYLRV